MYPDLGLLTPADRIKLHKKESNVVHIPEGAGPDQALHEAIGALLTAKAPDAARTTQERG